MSRLYLISDLTLFLRRYSKIVETISSLEKQLENAKEHLERLHNLKEQALADPERFLKETLNSNALPLLQVIKLEPQLDFSHYHERLPRRPITKYEQNLGTRLNASPFDFPNVFCRVHFE